MTAETLYKKPTTNDEILIVCNHNDAIRFITNNKEISLSDLVITEVVPEGELTLIPKAEFIEYLNGGLTNDN